MAWHDNYTKAEIENLLTNMCNWMGGYWDDNYNWTNSDREKLVETYLNMGCHEEEVRS